MPAVEQCSECGADLGVDERGLCRRCLLSLGLGADDPDGSGEVVSEIEPPAGVERVGSTVGRYKLLEEIGEGGFGVVYMAEQIAPVRRRVALKIIKAGMDTREVIARFEAERQALALMDHPNIAHVLDAGATRAGRPYFVMELVQGIPITEFCDKRKLATSERLGLFMQVCKAVQHAHQKGIIHRDLKPSNILVTYQESEPLPKIIDFGVAKALGQKLTERTLFTGFLLMVGTPAYMSPEQAEFTGMDVDTRSDIYSLGVLLYELLTGVNPFDSEAVRNAALDEVRKLIRETEPKKPSTRLQSLGDKLTEVARHRHTEAPKLIHLVRGDLDWIVMKCLEKDRRRRYETANGLAMDVQRHLEQQPVLAGPPSLGYRATKYMRRHWVGVAFVGCIAFALIAGLIVSLAGFAKARREEDRAVTAEKQALHERDRALVAEELSQEHLYRAQMRLASRDWEAGQLRAMMETLEGHIPESGEPDRRGWEWYYLWSLCHDPEKELARHDGPVTSVSMHPDGKWLASSSGSEVAVWDMDSGRKIADLSGHPGSVRCVAWSPDGSLLASSDMVGKVILWETDGFQVFHEIDCPDHVTQVTWSPDGSQLAGAHPDDRPGSGDDWVVKTWEASSGKELHRLHGKVGWTAALAWHPQGTMLAAGGGAKGWMQVWDPIEGRSLKTLKVNYHSILAVRWSPDGGRIATAGVDQRVRIWTTDTWELLLDIVPAHNGHVTALLWSEDGATLTSGGEDGLLKTWDAEDGELLHVLRAHINIVSGLCWSQDGDYMISGGGDPVIRRWRPGEDQTARVMGDSGICEWSPDERYLALGVGSSASDPGGVAILDTSTWQTLYRLPYPADRSLGRGGPSSWSPDGRKFAAVWFEAPVLQVWDVETRKAIWSWEIDQELDEGDTHGLEWSPDSRLLAASSWTEGTVRIWEPETGKLLQTFEGHGDAVDGLAWHPDGRRIASRTPNGRLLIWDAATGEVLREHHCYGWGAGMKNVVDWNPDGALLAAGCGNGSIRIWDDKTGQLVRVLKGHDGSVRSVCWSPDGRRLVSGAEDRTVRIWDPHSGRELIALPDREVWLPEVSWSPSGRMISMRSYQTRIYDARIGYELAAPR